jgi:RNA polymerase-binding transcription factor DksA
MASKKPAKVIASKPPAKSAKPAAKKAAAKKPAIQKTAANKAPEKKSQPKAVAASKPAAKKAAAPKKAAAAKAPVQQTSFQSAKPASREATKLTPFLASQRQKLLMLKDTLLDSMNGVARDSLRSQTGGDASAFGMHQADAGSDAYDRDFALGLLSMEQDSLYEIDQALKRIDDGSYGVCEISGKQIMKARLEALPFTRYTVECQAEIEKRNRYQRYNQPVTSLFGLSDEESEGEDEDNSSDSKDKD